MIHFDFENVNRHLDGDKQLIQTFLSIILPKFETRELVNNFRNLTISNEKANTQKIRSSLQSQSCS